MGLLLEVKVPIINSVLLLDLAHKYHSCPYCSMSPTSLSHQFWDCPCIQPFWQLVVSLLTSHGLPPTLNSFTDLYLFVGTTNTRDLLSIFLSDLIYNAMFPIWYNYNNLMFGHYGAPGDQEYSGHRLPIASPDQ